MKGALNQLELIEDSWVLETQSMAYAVLCAHLQTQLSPAPLHV